MEQKGNDLKDALATSFQDLYVTNWISMRQEAENVKITCR